MRRRACGSVSPGGLLGLRHIGNLLTKQEGTDPNYTLIYGGYAAGVFGPHAAWAVTVPGSSTRAELSYDPNGNICGTGNWLGCPTLSGYHTGESLYSYDAENRLVSMPDATAGTDTFDTFTYDANGVEVKRTMADGTYAVYIGGVFEEQHAASGAVTGVTKYYEFGGRAVAMRDPAGSVHYLLADHLESTSEVLSPTGAIESLQKYWPYDAARPVPDYGPVTQTDRDFTGQRKEVGDPASLGLYNYKARFYSTLLGRFVSADSKTTDGLNRYAYIEDSPMAGRDPSGLDIVVACGFTDHCESGDSGTAFQALIEEYWKNKGMFSQYGLDGAFGLMMYVIEHDHWMPSRVLAAFGAAFVDTSTTKGGLLSHHDLSPYVDKITQLVAHDSKVDFLAGFSEGGAAVAKWLNSMLPEQFLYGRSLLQQIRYVYLIEPALNLSAIFGDNAIDASLFPGIQFVTRNGDFAAPVHGAVASSPNNFTDTTCVDSAFDHCAHKYSQALDVDVAFGSCYAEPSALAIACQNGGWYPSEINP